MERETRSNRDRDSLVRREAASDRRRAADIDSHATGRPTAFALPGLAMRSAGEPPIGHQSAPPADREQSDPLADLRTIRRRPIGLPTGAQIETSELKRKELARLQKEFPAVAGEIQEALDENDFRVTRFRAMDSLSEGESEEDEIVTGSEQRSYFRSLRADEDPQIDGLLPPSGHDPGLTVSAHVNSGSKAKVKSRYISASHSKHLTGAWAGSEGSGLVAQFTRPPGAEFHDLARPTTEHDNPHQLGVTAANAARASQEVLFGDPVGPRHITALWKSKKVTLGKYNARGGTFSSPTVSQFTTRARGSRSGKKLRPQRYRMKMLYDFKEDIDHAEKVDDRESEMLVMQSRERWDFEIARATEEINAKRSPENQMDEDDVAEAVTESGLESAYELDFFQNGGFLRQYVRELSARLEEVVKDSAAEDFG